MNADGSAQVRLTTAPQLDAFPEWSPDGQYIAFRSDRAGNLEVFVMAADGSGQFNWTNYPAGDCHPRWTAVEAANLQVSRLAPTPAPVVAGVPGRTSRAGAGTGALERCLGS
jgi:hypothetical protein